MKKNKTLMMRIMQQPKPKTLSALLRFSTLRPYSSQEIYSPAVKFYRELNFLTKRGEGSLPFVKNMDRRDDRLVTLDIRNAVFDLLYSKKKLTFKKLRLLHRKLRKYPKGD
jgi:hypothetical protein